MKLVIDLPETKEEIQNELNEQVKKFKREGLLPITDEEWDELMKEEQNEVSD